MFLVWFWWILLKQRDRLTYRRIKNASIRSRLYKLANPERLYPLVHISLNPPMLENWWIITSKKKTKTIYFLRELGYWFIINYMFVFITLVFILNTCNHNKSEKRSTNNRYRPVNEILNMCCWSQPERDYTKWPTTVLTNNHITIN